VARRRAIRIADDLPQRHLLGADQRRPDAEAFGLGGAPDWVVIAMFVVLTGTTGMFTGVALVSGPGTTRSPRSYYRDAGLPAWFWLLTFTFVAVAIRFAQAWLRLKTDSVWPPIFLHASHNLWMQSIFTPLTTEKEYTKWIAGDLGLAFVVVAAVVAVVFWLKRGELPGPACG
jgi:hypothetical protein